MSAKIPKRRTASLKGHPTPKQKQKIETVMHEWKHGRLHSGSKTGPVVKSQKQAVAIALSEQRKASARPQKPKTRRHKKGQRRGD